MAVLDMMLVVVGLWTLLALGALMLVCGIGAAAAAADRNARRLVRVQHAATSGRGGRVPR